MNVLAFVLWDGNKKDAEECLARDFPKASYTILTKRELSEKSPFGMLKLIRHKFDSAFIFSKDLDFQTKIFFLSIFLILTKARKLFFTDPKGRVLQISRTGFVFKQIPSFIIEAILSFAAIAFLFTLTIILKPFFWKKKTRKKNTNPTVLFLRTEFAFQVAGGGSVTHINGIAKGFTESGYKVIFVSNEKMESVDYTTRVIVPSSFFINFPDVPQLVYNFKFFVEGIRYIKEFKPEFLYLRHDFYTLSGLLLSMAFNIPLILENNGIRLWEKSYWDKVYIVPLVRFIEDSVLTGCEQIVVVTETIKDECVALGVPEDKILVTPNAVDPDMFYPGVGLKKEVTLLNKSLSDSQKILKKIEGKKVVAYSGSFINFHGIDVLQSAIPTVFSSEKDVCFLLIGDGEMRPNMESFIKENNWEDRILLTGCIPLAEVPGCLDIADILLAPYVPLGGGSSFFGSSVKQFEYMAMGKGIIASNIGQLGKILKHEENALLIKPGDYNDLANSILRLLKDKKLCEHIGSNARRDVLAKHTWGKNVEAILEHNKATSIFS